MPLKSVWDQYELDYSAWIKDQVQAWNTAVKNLLFAHHSDPPSTEIGYPTGSVPSSPPPPPPGS